MKKLRIVSYAINGRGVGHLVRQLAILRWVRRYAGLLGVNVECWVLTTSEADTLARREGFAAFKMPSKAMMRDAGIEPAKWIATARQWVLNAVAGLSPDLLIVDTFPGGSFGELVPVLEMVPTRVLVARPVREEFAADDAYKALLPMYQRLVVPENVLLREREELLSRVDARSALGIPDDKRAVYVTLGGGGDEMAPRVLPVLTERLVARGWHVVVGAGPLYAGPEKRGASITWIDRYVPLELLAGVDAAVSAGGYNAVTELMFAGVPTVFLPQPRIADDQEGRAQHAADAGAGRFAKSLDEIPDLLDAPGSADAARALVPVNGARAAAAQILSTVLPQADLALATSVLSPALWARAQRIAGLTQMESALELVTCVLGDTPSASRDKEALLAEIVDDGAIVSAPVRRKSAAAERVEKLLAVVEETRAPIEHVVSLVRGLRRKFPAAGIDGVVDACAQLFPVWSRFADWMGAVSLVNALPAQRAVTIFDTATSLTAWLASEDDLFDALRRFARLEGNGALPLAEVLRQLVPA